MLEPDRLAALPPESLRPLRRSEYDQLIAAGAFEDERVELLYGRIVRMTPPGPLHADVVDRLTEVLVMALRGRARVRVQNPFAASSWSEPEPDLAVVPRGDFRAEHPSSALLVVEVADSSLRKDREVKAPLYAAAGVPEYWLVDAPGRLVEVHTDIEGGVYTRVLPFRPGERIRLRELPDVEIAVSDFLA